MFFLLFSPLFFFFFNDTATTEIYTLSLHDALPTSSEYPNTPTASSRAADRNRSSSSTSASVSPRSEEHTSELQSRPHLVCRLLLEKKKKTTKHELNGKKKKKKKKKNKKKQN